jgi:hypothetical protein
MKRSCPTVEERSMNTVIPFRLAPPVAALLAALSLPAVAAPTVYEMRLTTSGGMGAGGMGGMFSAMMGGGSSTSRSMDLRLTSPTDLPSSFDANHVVPDTMGVGPKLPLRGERRSGGRDTPGGEPEQPDGRVLIYWGCSPTVGKGQPEIIDFRAMAGKLPPEVAAMARQSRSQGKGGGEGSSLPPRTITWPGGDPNFRGLSASASAVGDHAVKTNFMKDEIAYKVTPAIDFLDPMNLKARAENLKAAIPLAWDAVPRVRGWDLQAVGPVGEKEIVIWLADRNKSPMLPASQKECTIPEGIFAKSEMAMANGTAHGPVQGFSFPPQPPGEKKLPVIWSATVRVMGHDMLMLGMPAMERGGARGESSPKPSGEAASDSLMPPGVGNVLKGIFGR